MTTAPVTDFASAADFASFLTHNECDWAWFVVAGRNVRARAESGGWISIDLAAGEVLDALIASLGQPVERGLVDLADPSVLMARDFGPGEVVWVMFAVEL
jgi:hypothetical protein